MERLGIEMSQNENEPAKGAKMTAMAEAGGVAVSAHATEREDGTVKCTVECNGQTAHLVFTGTDVMVDIPRQ